MCQNIVEISTKLLNVDIVDISNKKKFYRFNETSHSNFIANQEKLHPESVQHIWFQQYQSRDSGSYSSTFHPPIIIVII